MWIPMGGVYVVVALAVLARLIGASGQGVDGRTKAQAS